MSGRVVTWKETEFTDRDLMSRVRQIMCEGKTGQIVLHLSQGRVLGVTLREKQVVDTDADTNIVDKQSVPASESVS
jgi:hypothetical protein